MKYFNLPLQCPDPFFIDCNYCGRNGVGLPHRFQYALFLLSVRWPIRMLEHINSLYSLLSVVVLNLALKS